MEPIKKLLDGQKFSEFNAKKKEHDSLQKILLDCLDKKFKGKVHAKNMLNDMFIIGMPSSPPPACAARPLRPHAACRTASPAVAGQPASDPCGRRIRLRARLEKRRGGCCRMRLRQ